MRRWGRRSAPTAALIGLLALAGPGVARTPIGADEYLERLSRARELAVLEGSAPSPERMDDVRGVLGLPLEVAIGDWVAVVGPDPILEELTGTSEADFAVAEERLTALEGSLAGALAVDPPASDRVGPALAQAYSGVVPPRPNVVEILLQVFGEVIEAVVQRIGTVLASAGAVLAWLVLAGVGVIAIAFLVRGRLVPDRVSAAGEMGRGGAGSIDWAARADEALRAGDLHEAVRTLYLSLLAVLVSRGVVADAPALTAGEARYAVRRSRPTLFPAIARATDSYERVIYGGDAPDLDDIQRLREATAEARRP